MERHPVGNDKDHDGGNPAVLWRPEDPRKMHDTHQRASSDTYICSSISTMAAPVGMKKRSVDGTVALYARINPDVRQRLAESSKAMGVTMAAFLEELVRHMETDKRGLPSWAEPREIADQLPLQRVA